MNDSNPLSPPLDTPAPQDTHQPSPDFWQVVSDILDNPFLKPCEREQALHEQGLRLIKI